MKIFPILETKVLHRRATYAFQGLFFIPVLIAKLMMFSKPLKDLSRKNVPW